MQKIIELMHWLKMKKIALLALISAAGLLSFYFGKMQWLSKENNVDPITLCQNKQPRSSIMESAFLFFFPKLSSKNHDKVKVYDCFLFFNELDVLEIRLKELYDSVDYFILVESKETFRGNKKELFFDANKNRFAPYLEKIIHIIVDADFICESPWTREHHQRAQIIQGIHFANKHDMVMLSDVDEIPRPSAIIQAKELLLSSKAHVVVFKQDMYCGRLNLLHGPWQGTVATTAAKARKIETKTLRKLRNMRKKHIKRAGIRKMQALEHGGWHFNSIGDLTAFITKLSSFSHAELDVTDEKKEEMYQKMLKQFKPVSVDSTFPKTIQDNLPYYNQKGLIYNTENNQKKY